MDYKTKVIKVLDLFQMIKEKKTAVKTYKEARKLVEAEIIRFLDPAKQKAMTQLLHSILQRRFEAKTEQFFLQKHAKWLDSDVEINEELPLGSKKPLTISDSLLQQSVMLKKHGQASTSKAGVATPTAGKDLTCPSCGTAVPIKLGRPKKTWRELSRVTKKRKVDDCDSQELYEGTQLKLAKKGKRRASKAVEQLCTDPDSLRPKRAKKEKIPVQKALLWLIETDMSVRNYMRTRELLCNLPGYKAIAEAKQLSYPPGIVATRKTAYVPIPALLAHTAERIMKISPIPDDINEVNFLLKWGLDGSAAAVNIKKAVEGEEGNLRAESSVFVSSLVPLELSASGGERVLWVNPAPCSSRFCRPIRISFTKETNEVTKEEIAYVEDGIREAGKLSVKVADRNVTVNITMVMTMVDGKVCNAAMGNKSTLRCYICNATSKNFNEIDAMMERSVDEQAVQFGLSPLHCRIRVMESLVHLADRLPVTPESRKKLSDSDKIIIEQNKNRIRIELRKELGLLIDVVKQGFGNCNDGNTSRIFFDNIEIVSKVTNLDIGLLTRFKIILQVISCGRKVDVSKFEAFCLETARQYIKKYPWSKFTPTVHKLLCHSPYIIQQAILPIGALSEEAAEATNKVIRRFRETRSRRFDLAKCNEDVLKRLLLMSDPYFSCLLKRNPPKHKPLLPETLDLLVTKEIPDVMEVNEDALGEVDYSDEDEQLSSDSE